MPPAKVSHASRVDKDWAVDVRGQSLGGEYPVGEESTRSDHVGSVEEAPDERSQLVIRSVDLLIDPGVQHFQQGCQFRRRHGDCVVVKIV